MHQLESPRARYKFGVDTDKPCSQCLFLNTDPKAIDCACHGIDIVDEERSTCPSWVNGVPCDEHGEDEERFRIKASCVWCDYSNEIEDVANCQFEDWNRALGQLLGTHIMTEHADQIAHVMGIFTGEFQAFCRLAVDAAGKVGRLADYGRKAGRVVGNLKRKADKVGK